MDDSYDVIIVGGGAAGLSAALVLGRARRRVALVDAGAPRNAPASHMQGYLSRDGLPPLALVAIGRQEAASYGVALLDGRVTSVDADLVVSLADGRSLSGRRLLLTTGLVDVLPEIPGVRERWGRDLLHCPYCHGWEVRDEPLGVLGTHPAAVQHALLIRQWSEDVAYFPHVQALSDDDEARLSARGVAIERGRVHRLVVVDDLLRGIQVDDRVVARTAVFVRPGHRSRSDLAASLGCETDADGLAVVDRTGRTSVDRVWAAGNATNPRAQVITAAGEGSAAAIAINNDLVDEDVAAAAALHN